MRIDLIKGLDLLVQRLERNAVELASEKRNAVELASEKFDSIEARRIRVEAGLTQDKLVENIVGKGLSRKFQNYICRYEKGKANPFNSKFGRKYLNWLEKNGYQRE